MTHHDLVVKAALVLMAGGLAACSENVVGTLPTLPPPVSPAPAPTPFPAIPRPGTEYLRTTRATYGPERYVLFEDSTFALQVIATGYGFMEFKGRYAGRGSEIDLVFDANPLRWFATAVIRGDSLAVKYNIDMQMSDFEDGVFRSPPRTSLGRHIYLTDSAGLNPTRLVTGEWPAWSPDAQKIAFHRDGYVHVIDADGSDEVRLAKGGFPAWSPDGTRIAFTNRDGIAVMSSDGSNVTTLIRRDFASGMTELLGIGKASWSPDGSRIAFEHFGDGDMQPAQIYVMNADGSNERRLTTAPGGYRYAESDPSWSPDGSKITFWSYGYGIATVSASGGEPTSLYLSFPTAAYGSRPTFSPDGSSIAFTAGRFLSSKPAVWTIGLANASTKAVASGYDAAWSPGAGRIAFVRAEGN